MNNPVQLSTQNTTEDTNVICFDGQQFELIQALREFFEEYHLKVIEGALLKTGCLYQIICGPPQYFQHFPSIPIRDAKQRLVIILNGDHHIAQKLLKQFSAKVALIGPSPLTFRDARVVFGLLFSDDQHIIDVRNESSLPTQIIENRQQHSTYKNETHLNWEDKKTQINDLLVNQYKPVISTTSPIFRFLLPLRYAFAIFSIFVLLHISGLILSIILIVSSLTTFTYIRHPISRFILDSTVISGTALSHPLSFIPTNSYYTRLLDNLDRTSKIISTISNIKKQQISGNLLVGQNVSPVASVQQIQQHLISIAPLLHLIESDIKLFRNQTISIKYLQPLFTNIQQEIQEIKTMNEHLIALSEIYLQAAIGQSSYLLLFQNNKELRPTGGFIGSVGLITLNQGNVTDTTIEDVYAIDGQLRGHVDPPNPIRTILQQEHWYLRDSNWSPDFETSAEKAVFFLDKSIGKKVDGVIGISLPVLEKILLITGPIKLPDYQTEINADSLFSFIHKTTHDDFFPGSQQKKSVLQAVATALTQRISLMNDKQLLQLARLLTTSVSNRDIQLYSSHDSLQTIIKSYRFSGSFPLQKYCPTQMDTTCLDDLFAFVEANMAVNKTNAYINRQYEREIYIDEKELFRLDRLSWENTANPASLGGGNYTQYFRAYYPIGTTIQNITLNDKDIRVTEATMSAKPLPYAELIDEIPGILTVGIAIDIHPGEKSTLTIKNTQGLPKSLQTYALSFFKQAGTETIPIEVTIKSTNKPFHRDPILSSYLAVDGSFTYNRSLQRDERVVLTMTPEAQ